MHCRAAQDRGGEGTEMDPNAWIADLTVTTADGARRGATGFLIGPNDIVTNAHVVLDASGGLPAAVEVRLPDGRMAMGARVDAFSNSGFFGSAPVNAETVRQDLALITLDRPLTTLGDHFDWSYGPDLRPDSLTVGGYPARSFDGDTLVFDTVEPVYDTALGRIVFESALVQPGSSGSPLFAQVDDRFVALGVLSVGGPFSNEAAALFDAETLSALLGWAEANGFGPLAPDLPPIEEPAVPLPPPPPAPLPAPAGNPRQAIGLVETADGPAQLGTLVGPNDVLTAAARLRDRDGSLREDITVTLGDASYDVVGVLYFDDPDHYDDGAIGSRAMGSNLALLTLDRAVSGADQIAVERLSPADSSPLLVESWGVEDVLEPEPMSRFADPLRIHSNVLRLDDHGFSGEGKGAPVIDPLSDSLIGVVSAGDDASFYAATFSDETVEILETWIAENGEGEDPPHDTAGIDPLEPSLAFEVETLALLYNAVLGRGGRFDWRGFNWWVDAIEAGATLADAAAAMLSSAEFEERHGTFPDGPEGDLAFLDVIYQNAYGRAPDAEGAAYWSGLLADGLPREAAIRFIATAEEARVASEVIFEIEEIYPSWWEYA
ncbi:MAG: DUF4214 domain-containing protein [Pseudomonadota bacterium]